MLCWSREIQNFHGIQGHRKNLRDVGEPWQDERSGQYHVFAIGRFFALVNSHLGSPLEFENTGGTANLVKLLWDKSFP